MALFLLSLPQFWYHLCLLNCNFSLKSTIVPLFEKVLSASDAGRIGRLVLPKACAEVRAYFFRCFVICESLDNMISCLLSLWSQMVSLWCTFFASSMPIPMQAYFPPINQSEGLPIRIQDIKGKEWTFQFRFWPNNNSRMYVLEGVTPCIQNMQLQAGDTGNSSFFLLMKKKQKEISSYDQPCLY